MANIPKVNEYYKKSDTTKLIIRSFKPDKYDIMYFQAKRKYHSTLATAYGAKEGLEHLLCTIEDDYGMQIANECYFAN